MSSIQSWKNKVCRATGHNAVKLLSHRIKLKPKQKLTLISVESADVDGWLPVVVPFGRSFHNGGDGNDRPPQNTYSIVLNRYLTFNFFTFRLLKDEVYDAIKSIIMSSMIRHDVPISSNATNRHCCSNTTDSVRKQRRLVTSHNNVR